jgi:hypothetical protein
MKKTYTSPQLFVHGRVEDITEAFGQSQVNDTAYIGSQQLPGSTFGLAGSQDGILVPKN